MCTKQKNFVFTIKELSRKEKGDAGQGHDAEDGVGDRNGLTVSVRPMEHTLTLGTGWTQPI
jgi:hypothetical protein